MKRRRDNKDLFFLSFFLSSYNQVFDYHHAPICVGLASRLPKLTVTRLCNVTVLMSNGAEGGIASFDVPTGVG